MERINVTKTFLPPQSEYQRYLDRIWAGGQLTNQGPLVHEFEDAVRTRLNVERFQFVANGTIALQLALRGLEITGGEIITTPFSYVATTSAIMWERCRPVFVDIEPETFCIDPSLIEAAITSRTRAIVAVHVFGNPCDTEAIEAVAAKHNLKVIYDAAHAFGVMYRGKTLLDYGDISICSFHATKLFHTVEGGAIVARDQAVDDRVELMKRFGHTGDEHFALGINAKASELHAAMGLCNLKYVDRLIGQRHQLSDLYDELLDPAVRRPRLNSRATHNYGYYPVVLRTEDQLLRVVATLNEANIFPRRYFYPALNTLPYVEAGAACPVAEDIARRILCLPLYAGLDRAAVKRICGLVEA